MKSKSFILKRLLSLTLILVLLTSGVSSGMGEIVSIDKTNELFLSTDWKDYAGDLETFVYGLIYNQLKCCYDVFPAYVDLSDGTSVSGLAYTDYSKCYANEDESEYCFEAGLIPYSGELPIPEEDFDSGLELHNLDYPDGKGSFVLTYGSGAFSQHCVAYGKYLTFGVDEMGQVFYSSRDYSRGDCDETLGTLYSYDEQRVVFEADLGNYAGITGDSLYDSVDYAEIEREVARILENQDRNFVTVDVVSCAHIAQDTVVAYFQSLQEETFLGYNVDALIAAAKELDPLECFRLTKDGLMTIEMEYVGEASLFTKWLVGTSCVIVTAVSAVGSMVTIACPALSSMCSTMAGTAIEIFMQVVMSSEDLDSIKWNKVVMASASGAVSGLIGPYIAATEGFTYFIVDTSIDAIIGGVEQGVNAWMDGKDAEEMIKSSGYGCVIGFGLSGGFKCAGEAVKKIAKQYEPQINKVKTTISPKLVKRVSKLVKTANDKIGLLKNVVDSTRFHDKELAEKIIAKQMRKLQEDGSDEILSLSLNHLGNKEFVDLDGNVITKETIRNNAKKAADGTVLAIWKIDDVEVSIVKQNSVVGIRFDPEKYLTIELDDFLSSDREDNLCLASGKFLEVFKKDSSLIPQSLAELFIEDGVPLNTSNEGLNKKVKAVIQQSDWVLHENIDLKTVSLVPRFLHDSDVGITHLGGVALAKHLKSHMGIEYFDRFVSTAATNAVNAVS